MSVSRGEPFQHRLSRPLDPLRTFLLVCVDQRKPLFASMIPAPVLDNLSGQRSVCA